MKYILKVTLCLTLFNLEMVCADKHQRDQDEKFVRSTLCEKNCVAMYFPIMDPRKSEEQRKKDWAVYQSCLSKCSALKEKVKKEINFNH